MSRYQLAELNIAKMRESLESPAMVDFVNNLDRVNTIADQAPGFVWRLKDEIEEAAAMSLFGNDYVVNMLDHLRVHGPGPSAFTFKRSYLPPPNSGTTVTMSRLLVTTRGDGPPAEDAFRQRHRGFIP